MFGNRFFNKIVKSDGNVQVSGNVGKIEIGIKIEDHLRALDERAAEIRKEQEELRRSAESSLKSEALAAEETIKRQQFEIDKLKDIIGDPQKYLDYTEDASFKIAALLLELEEKRLHGDLEEIRKEIKAGALANAEKLLEQIEKLPSLNAKLKSETISVRATLAFLDLQFDKAEALSRRAFYLDPSIGTLVTMLDQLDMNGERSKLLSTLAEAKAVLPGHLDSHTSAQLIAIEAWSSATAGDLTRAKLAIRAGEAATRSLPNSDNNVAIQFIVCKASISVFENDQSSALKHFKAALKRLRENEDEEDLFITRIEANIGACLAELGRVKEAIDITTGCVERFRKEGDTARYHLGIRLNNLGDFLTRDGRAKEALEVLRESIELAQRTLPERHPSLIRRRLNFSIALKKMGNTEGAIRELHSIEVNEADLSEMDKRSLVKAKSALFGYCVETSKWVDALSAATGIQKIGTEYLSDKKTAAALPRVITAIRYAVLSGDFSQLETQSAPRVWRPLTPSDRA